MPTTSETHEWVACRVNATPTAVCAPLATITAPTFMSALAIAETMYGYGLVVGRRQAYPNLWEDARDREWRAEHASRTESIWQALVRTFKR